MTDNLDDYDGHTETFTPTRPPGALCGAKHPRGGGGG